MIITINEKDYELKITTKGCMNLERALGYNPLQMFFDLSENKLPKFYDTIVTFQAMLQPLNHGINLDAAADLFDDYKAEGHTMFDLAAVLMQTFQECGFVPKGEAEEGKN